MNLKSSSQFRSPPTKPPRPSEKRGYFFPKKLPVRNNLDGTWTLLRQLHYISRDGRRFDVPKFFRTDFGSIPRPLQGLPGLQPNGTPADPCYVLHDWFYKNLRRYGPRAVCTKEQADRLLLQSLKDNGITFLRRWTIYLGVVIGGTRATRRRE